MARKDKIPVHSMDDWFSGIYLKPFGAGVAAGKTYETGQAHRHDFYYCVLLDKGDMEIEVDFEQVQLSDQSLFLSYPGQVHRIISARPERGWFLAFDPALLNEPLRNILDQCLAQIMLVPLSAGQAGSYCAQIDHLYAVYNDESQLFRQAITRSIVESFIYQLASAYLSMERVMLSKHTARSIELTKNFKQILRREFKIIKSPSAFAAKMNISISHLNDTVRAVTGFSVTYYIQQELMREAQRLLYHTDLTVKKIAEELGFEDDKYFNRLFSKVIGVSPGTFRKKRETIVYL